MDYEFKTTLKDGRNAIVYVIFRPHKGDDGELSCDDFKMVIQAFKDSEDPDGTVYTENKFPDSEEWNEIETIVFNQSMDNAEDEMEQLKTRDGNDDYS